ncbi:MAG TPA: peptidoglycan-binding domain-containing protein [Pyrinomonadaceae bacterium]|jgi:hypothetical protein
MALNYVVKQGECISSIAFEHGFFPDTLWDHPDNARLKEKRKDPNILMPGDVVFIPDKRVKEVSEATDSVYKYKLKGVPAKMILRLLYSDEPLKNEPYTLDVDGKITEGKTDNEGKVRISILPNAKKGKLTVGKDDRKIEYVLDLGWLDPIETIVGAKKRLHNLGYDVGKIDEKENEELERAIRLFESDHELEQTGRMSAATRRKLQEIYGC